jgi:hypothetical protein
MKLPGRSFPQLIEAAMTWTDLAILAAIGLPWAFGVFALLHGLIRWRQ